MDLEGYIGVLAAADRLGVKKDRILKLCKNPKGDKLPGAVLYQGRWMIPIVAVEGRRAQMELSRIPDTCPHCGGRIRGDATGNQPGA